jgi:hypothetical protein
MFSKTAIALAAASFAVGAAALRGAEHHTRSTTHHHG